MADEEAEEEAEEGEDESASADGGDDEDGGEGSVSFMWKRAVGRLRQAERPGNQGGSMWQPKMRPLSVPSKIG